MVLHSTSVFPVVGKDFSSPIEASLLLASGLPTDYRQELLSSAQEIAAQCTKNATVVQTVL